MSELDNLSPAAIWKYFDLICSIPHPSGSEAALADKIVELAKETGFSCQRDPAGNLRIDRPAAPGFETKPLIILQGHLDMVPVSSRSGFDFLTMPVKPQIDGEWVRADGTTLGADNGIGVALALAMLFDCDLQCGPLAALLTVREEVGLTGSSLLAPEMLTGTFLLNLDSDVEGELCIGCAGGAKSEFIFTPEYAAETPPCGVEIKLTGLPGGHSGICIGQKRGNAIRFLAEFLDQHPQIAIAAISGGDADNAIPGAASAYGAIAAGISLEELNRSAAILTAMLQKESDFAGNLQISITPAPAPCRVWSEKFRNDLTAALLLAPDGVLDFDEQLDIVRTSSNLAAVITGDEKICIRTSQRSMADSERDNACAVLAAHFAAFGASGSVSNTYPGWEPQPDSPLIRSLDAVRQKLFGTGFVIRAIHAGLECGWFSRKNPALQMVSFGPQSEEIHTPGERVNIASVRRCYDFLREVLISLNV